MGNQPLDLWWLGYSLAGRKSNRRSPSLEQITKQGIGLVFLSFSLLYRDNISTHPGPMGVGIAHFQMPYSPFQGESSQSGGGKHRSSRNSDWRGWGFGGGGGVDLIQPGVSTATMPAMALASKGYQSIDLQWCTSSDSATCLSTF